MGGKIDNPTYKDVCYSETGHVEVVQVTYDPYVVSYEQLLVTFFESHDPTQVNRQGPDVGTQYRTAIFYHDDEQKAASVLAVKRINDAKVLKNPVATEVVEVAKYYPAEDYHQQYLEKNGISGHCGFPTSYQTNGSGE